MKHTILLALAALLAAPLGVSAQTVVHNPIEVSADTYVSQTNPSSYYGTSDNISIRGTTGGDNNRYSYLQFDLSTFDEPITAATLTLTAVYNVTNRTASTIELYGLIYGTAEDALALGLEGTTFNNNTAPWAAVRPGQFTAPANATSLLSTAAIPASGSFSGGTTFTFASTSDLVSLLESARTTSGIVTLVIIERTSQGNALNLASKENTTYAGPTLTITTTAIPEPATLAALAGAVVLVLAAALRRRR